MASADVLEQQTPLSSAGEAGHELVIRPPGRWSPLALGDVWQHRELLYFLTKRDLSIRYKQSILGVTWAVGQPLALALIFWVFFGRLAKVPSDGIPYPVFSLAALVSWNFVSQAVTQGAASLVADSNLLSKVYFPRLVVPLGRVASLGVDALIALCVLAVFMIGYAIAPPLQVLLLPAFLLLGAIVAFSLGSFLAALNVRYRDVSVAVPLMVQMWLFLTPVVYPASLVGGAWKYVYALNPMVTVVTGARWSLLDTPAPPIGQVCISVGVALFLLVGSLTYFRRVEHFFADVV
jgi:lipopolysaccharide transport system permease protein